MKKYQFKTNIKCNGCIAQVTPYLNNVGGIKKWDVDTANPDKVLSVEAEGADEIEITEVVKQAGYTAELLP